MLRTHLFSIFVIKTPRAIPCARFLRTLNREDTDKYTLAVTNHITF